MEELNSIPPKTNPSSGREEDLNPAPPDYKSSALTTRPRCLHTACPCTVHQPWPVQRGVPGFLKWQGRGERLLANIWFIILFLLQVDLVEARMKKSHFSFNRSTTITLHPLSLSLFQPVCFISLVDQGGGGGGGGVPSHLIHPLHVTIAVVPSYRPPTCPVHHFGFVMVNIVACLLLVVVFGHVR